MRPGLGATYRVQLGGELTFGALAGRLEHLVALGIQTLYTSPVAEAVPGSTHGYDGTDPGSLRAELGGAAGFAELSSACEAAGLGLCIDLVPNHLSTWPGGPWWRRLLAEGRESELAPVFDVAWDAPGQGGGAKVSLPLLDRPLPEALAAGLVGLEHRGADDVVVVGGLDLPVAGGRVRPGEDLAEVLAAQHYRLVDWHDGAARNYRRFFDIDGLVGVRVEVPEVFERTHRLVRELAATGAISAIRVDHVDGLADPAGYLGRLQAATGLPVLVEKILTGDERLRSSWPVAGTTGYEVLDDLGGALVDPQGHAALVAAGRAEGDPEPGPATVEARDLVARTAFGAEIDRLAGGLALEPDALRDTLVRLPVYRTYLPPDGAEGDPDDLEVLAAAGGSPARDRVVAALLDPARRPAALAAQQLMGAVMAKGVEDTAWYRLAGPLGFCEVGGDPGRDRREGVARLHLRAGERAVAGTAGLCPSSTHDTKRSGDVRARHYALGEDPARFEAGLAAFRAGLAARSAPLADAARLTRLLAATVLAVLPAGGAAGPELVGRVEAALTKGAREAKLATSWTAPDAAYEAALSALVAAALADDAAAVRDAFGGLVDDVARLGAVLSLSAVVLRSALPGVPDCYQGDETWNLSLVDPDNRRRVDPARLETLWRRLATSGDGDDQAARLRRSWRDGALKLLVTARCLAARAEVPEAFAPGAAYRPLRPLGPHADSLVGFLRSAATGGAALALATRLPGRLACDPGDLPSGASLGATVVELPPGAPTAWRDALSGRPVVADGRLLRAGAALGQLPVALLLTGGSPPPTGSRAGHDRRMGRPRLGKVPA